jgi:hypothetical protein
MACPACRHDVRFGHDGSGRGKNNCNCPSPIDTSLVDYLIRYVSPGDGVAAAATTKPKPHPKPIVPGALNPH